MDPRAEIVPLALDLANDKRAPPPATVRTDAESGMALLDGSSATVAGCPGDVGVTATMTRLSFSDSADTLAAYEACRYRVSQPSGIFSSSNAVASPTMSPVMRLIPFAATMAAKRCIGADGPPGMNFPESAGSPSPRRYRLPLTIPSGPTAPSCRASVLN